MKTLPMLAHPWEKRGLYVFLRSLWFVHTEHILPGWLLREWDEHTHWMWGSRKWWDLVRETKRGVGFEEGFLPVELTWPLACSISDAMGYLGLCMHYAPYTLLWKALEMILMDLQRDSEFEPLWVSPIPNKSAWPISHRASTHQQLQTTKTGQWKSSVLGLRLPYCTPLCAPRTLRWSHRVGKSDTTTFQPNFSPVRWRGNKKQIKNDMKK